MAISVATLTSGVPVPHKAAMVGFALQSAKGSTATSPEVFLPTHEDFDLNPEQNFQFFQFPEGRLSGPSHFFVGGYGVPGTIRMPIYPGMMNFSGGGGGLLASDYTPADTLADIGAWAFARDTLETGGAQGLWATLFRYTGHKAERFGDVKVLTAQITAQYGQLLVLELSVLGCAEPVAWATGGSPTHIGDSADPYSYNHCSLTLHTVSDSSTQNHTLNFDNMVASPDDAGTLSGQLTPLYLPNGELATVTGNFSRHFLNSTVYDAFLARTTTVYTLVADNGAGAELTLTMPRILYSAAPLQVRNTGHLKQDGINFQALADGATAAWQVTESV
jgi:hypothetical protein